VPDVTMTTNGSRLAGQVVPLYRSGLRRINVSLDSLDPVTYRTLTRGGELAPTIEGIEAAVRAGFSPVKLNMVVLRGINDGEVARVARFGLERSCHVRFLELMPIGVAAARHDKWLVSSGEVRARLAEAFDLQPMPAEPRSSSRNFLAADRSGLTGTLGFISPCTEPFCDGCRRLRLTASGRLLGCLAREEGLDVRPLLQGSSERLFDAVENALRLKRSGRGFSVRENMVCIGG
jgi:cyclic pyranopterin phosphate synthase